MRFHNYIVNDFVENAKIRFRFTPSSKTSAGGGKAAPLIPFTVTPPRPSGPTQVAQFFFKAEKTLPGEGKPCRSFLLR
jgi:hypothetical protein